MNPLPIRIRAVVLACVLPLAAAAPARAAAQTSSYAQFDVRFMITMIDHHAMAVHAATHCLSSALRDELIEMCHDIVATQQEEIETMQDWLQEWYGIAYEPQMTAGMERQMERLAGLTGAAFEVEFMKRMIRHHWTAVVHSAGCIDRAEHEELVAQCGEIIEAQVAEITQLRAWLCEWYGICNYGPKGEVAG